LLFLSPYIFSQEMKDFLPEHPLVFDVGAHHGGKTEHYLNLGASRVISVEPQVSCLDILRMKFGNQRKVIVEPLCLSDTSGTIPFYVSPSTTISTADLDWQEGRFKGWIWEQPIEISATTLDVLIERYGVPDFCKIDVEGYELSVLKGLSQPIPFLSFEFTAEYLGKKTKPCLEHLSSLGYKKFNVAFDNTEKFAFENWVDWPSLIIEIEKNPDPLYWGDIYARF